MRRRRGRGRKAGARERNGRIERRQAETPRQIAASMPHRKGLGELATDQRAATQLGRLVLRGELDATLGLAGETYLALWRGYVWTLAGPRELAAGPGGFSCGGCEQARHCRCEFRKRIFLEAQRVVDGCGAWVVALVGQVVLMDMPLPGLVRDKELRVLQVGLEALARHFGLTPQQNVVVRTALAHAASAPGP